MLQAADELGGVGYGPGGSVGAGFHDASAEIIDDVVGFVLCDTEVCDQTVELHGSGEGGVFRGGDAGVYGRALPGDGLHFLEKLVPGPAAVFGGSYAEFVEDVEVQGHNVTGFIPGNGVDVTFVGNGVEVALIEVIEFGCEGVVEGFESTLSDEAADVIADLAADIGGLTAEDGEGYFLLAILPWEAGVAYADAMLLFKFGDRALDILGCFGHVREIPQFESDGFVGAGGLLQGSIIFGGLGESYNKAAS